MPPHVRAMTERNPLRMLGAARVLVGSLLVLRTTPLLAPFGIPYLAGTTPLLGWPVAGWHVAAFGLDLPAWFVGAACVTRTAAAVLFALGVFALPAGVVAACLGWIVLAQDCLSYVNTLHLLLLATAVLAISGAGSAFALRPEPVNDPESGVTLTRALVASVYAWSGLAKLNGSWLHGDALAQLYANHLEISIHPDFFGFVMVALLLSFVEPRALTRTDPPTRPSPLATR